MVRGVVAGLGAIAAVMLALPCGCGARQRQVTVFTSLDRVYSEPVLARFEQQYGCKVNAVYDIEASKTTGLVNRLLAEKDHPEADVFWNSEVGRTLQLKEHGVLAPCDPATAGDIPAQFRDPEGYWYGMAARARVIVYNTELVDVPEVPQSVYDLAEPRWRGKAALANPAFGTTATHTAAIWAHLGEQKAKDYFRALNQNEVVIVPGNAAVRDEVARGSCLVGLTDTDDVLAGMRDGKPVAMVYPDQGADQMGTLVIPNTVCKIAGAPHPEPADELIEYLLSHETESVLAHSGSGQMPVRPGVAGPEDVPDMSTIKAMDVSFEAIAAAMPASGAFLRELFNR